MRIASSPCSGRTLARGSSHFGPAHGAEQHGVGLARELERRGRQRRARGVDGGAADERLARLERVPVRLGDGLEHADGLGRDLGPDPVTRQNTNERAHA